MAKIEKFEDLITWQKARELTVAVYAEFKCLKDFSFKDQIQRATVSIMNNSAEGFDRKGNKEFSKFLYIAKGSAAEVKSMLYLALDLKYIDKSAFDDLTRKTSEVSRILQGLIASLS
ncbi:MAG TPA: four helix bundle protein [bacterium]|nr:four helix bundle protein [bacterium]